MRGLFYDIIKGNKSNKWYITSAVIATVINLALWLGVTMNTEARFESEILSIMFGTLIPILHVGLLVLAGYLLYIMYNVEAHDIISEKSEAFIKEEFAKAKRINILEKIEHYVYAKYENGFVVIVAYDQYGNFLNDYKTNCFAEFLKMVNPLELKKIKRRIKLHEIF